jgi:predicted ABC-type ATPase
MAFASPAQRRWFFANKGGNSSGGGSSKKGKYVPGTDPVKTLVKQDEDKLHKAVKKSDKDILRNKKDVKKIEKYQKQLKTEGDSRKKFVNPKTGKYSADRRKLHVELIERVNNPDAFPKTGDKPKVVFIGGLTASGKTSAISKLLQRTRGETEDYKAYAKFVYLNADDFKSWLPEYKGYNAGYLHEESSDLFDEAVQRYKGEKKQIIIDATLKNTKNAEKRIKEFKRAGYETILYGTNIPGEKSIDRATLRFKRTKRYVPAKLIKKNAEPTNESVLKLRHKTDKYAVFNTDVKKGEAPELIESSKSLEKDRRSDSKIIVDTEEEWRKIGVDKSDLKGYDTKKHKKVKSKKI